MRSEAARAQRDDELQNVIAAAVWRRVTGEDGKWEDLWPVDREEFLEDASVVLAALASAGWTVEQPAPPMNLDDRIKAAIDTVAREELFRIVSTGALDPEDFPNVSQRDWTAVAQRVRERAEADRPAKLVLLDAYEYLTDKAEVDSA